MDQLTLAQARSWIDATASVIAENAPHLSELDQAIGDGDHGANMTRGFTAVVKKLTDGAKTDDLGGLFKLVGMTLLSSVGGASGPLYGGFFLDLGKQCAGKQTLDAQALTAVLESGLNDIKRRGKAEIGDKTMVDALTPAIEAMKAASHDVTSATRAAAETARDAATKTAPLLARKGRASYLGERSIGHEDPGANSMALLLGALAGVCHE
ncbi:dihydroxyacetone kinase subunit DhaL [Telmatospirillum sp.]|uniref:dihydroxyacetone kinase subunit DhaL n=1 Tax=Telmatospirillum sp. TaxID=2079197 RepID=UPI0028511242|nr:dihydroxyacetone kinase subunit DhaL [Telmatospirillum sp.]MDR3436742.1 dihydroxyacetone kinase subunit DhaL [Telmatospirillum sp.]